jgi:hypothetical protein
LKSTIKPHPQRVLPARQQLSTALTCHPFSLKYQSNQWRDILVGTVTPLIKKQRLESFEPLVLPLALQRPWQYTTFSRFLRQSPESSLFLKMVRS